MSQSEPTPRFQQPLIKPSMPFSSTRLLDLIMPAPTEGSSYSAQVASVPIVHKVAHRKIAHTFRLNLNSGSSLALACGMRRILWTLPDPVRLPSVVMRLTPLHTAFESTPLSSTRVTSLPQYYGPLRHPDNPVQSSRITGWHVPCHCQGFPCCHFSLLACVPVPIPRRKQTSARVAHFPICHRPSP